MKKIAIAFLWALAFGSLAFAQSAPAPAPEPAPAGYSNFSLTASAVSLTGQGQTTAATDLGQAFAITNNFSLRADEIMAPSANLNAYLGGFKYFIPTTKALAKTNLNASSFQFYVTGGAGVNRWTDATGKINQHIAAVAGGGVNWDPTNSGNFSVNVIEVRWARFPGFQNNTVLVSSGLKLSF